MPRQHVENTKEFWSENEATRANKHAHQRIIYWPPFWNKVYTPSAPSFPGCCGAKGPWKRGNLSEAFGWVPRETKMMLTFQTYHRVNVEPLANIQPFSVASRPHHGAGVTSVDLAF